MAAQRGRSPIEPRDDDRPVVLVTGVAGLIGRRLAADLAADHRVVGLDVHPPELEGDLVEFLETDLTSDESMAAVLAEVRETVGPRLASVVHLAAYYDFSGAPSPLYDALTVEGTRRLLRGLHAHVEHVEQLVFSSSLLVMKPVEPGDAQAVLTEESPMQAEWDYPASKIAAERVIEQQHGRTKAVILRLAGVYDEGGHSPPITQQIWRIRERKLESFLFPGDATNGQAFLHLDDAVACIRRVIEHRAALGGWEVFLVGEPEITSYGELQDLIGQALHGHAWPTLRVPAPVAKAGAWLEEKVGPEDEQFVKPWMVDLADAHYPVSIAKAHERLGWTPRHRLRDVLPEMLARVRRDPATFYRENDLPGAPEDARAAGH